VHFVPCRNVKVIGGVSGPEGLIPYRIAVFQCGNRFLMPFVPITVDPTLERVRSRSVSEAIGGPLRQAFLPLGPRMVPQRSQGVFVAIRLTGHQDVPGAARHGPVALRVPQLTCRFCRVREQRLGGISAWCFALPVTGMRAAPAR
jgi:hypothetical protein